MATVALTTTPTQIDDGTSYTVLVTNTGATPVDLSRGGRLRPGQSATVYPEGSALTVAATSGTGTVTTATTSKPLPNPSDPAALAARPEFTATYATLAYARQQAHTEGTTTIVTLVGGLDDETLAPFSSTCTVAVDTTNFDVAQGWKVTATAAGTPQARYTPLDAPNLTGASAIGFKVYIPDVTQITLIGLTINSGANQWIRTSSNFPQALVNGWNTLRWSVPAGTTTGWGTPTRIDVYGTSTATSATFTVGHIWAEKPAKGSLIFISDGPYEDFYQGAYPSLKARKVPVTFAIDPSLLGTGTGTTLRMTEAELDVAAYENGNTVAAHAWGDVLTSGMTTAQVRLDVMRVAKWLRNKGYPGGMWRAAWWQDSCPQYAAAKPLYLGMRTYKSDLSTTCWPPVDRYNIPMVSLIQARTTANVDAWFQSIRDFKQTAVMYMHRIGTGTNDCPQAIFDYVMQWIDTGVAAGWLEPQTFEGLFFRNGAQMLRGQSGRTWVQFVDETGAVVTQRIP